MRDLALAFNRDFTTGYLSGKRPGEVMGRERPDNRGIPIGVIRAFDPENGEATVIPQNGMVPEAGDGIEISPARGGGRGFGMVIRTPPGRVSGGYRIRLGRSCSPGDRVNLTRSARLEARVRGILARRRERRIPVDLDFTLTKERSPVLTGRFCSLSGEQITVARAADFTMRHGRTSPLTGEAIRSQMTRTGETPFTVRKFSIHYPGDLFAPLAALNRFRREFFQHAASAFQAANRPQNGDLELARRMATPVIAQLEAVHAADGDASIPYLSCYAATTEVVRGGIAGGCRRVYLEPSLEISRGRRIRGDLLHILREGGSLARSSGAEVFWKWPRITRRSFLDTASSILPALAETGISGVMVESIGLAEMVLSRNPALIITGGAGLNVSNHRSVRALCPPFRGLTLSPELNGQEIQVLAGTVRSMENPAVLEILVQGNLEAMDSEDCLPAMVPGMAALSAREFWGLQDETGRVFPVSLDAEGKTRIANAVELCLIDHVPLFCTSGIQMLGIDARGRTPRYAREVAGIYHRAIHIHTEHPQAWEANLPLVKEELKRRSCGGITQGHFPAPFGGSDEARSFSP
jgi:putative protease